MKKFILYANLIIALFLAAGMLTGFMTGPENTRVSSAGVISVDMSDVEFDEYGYAVKKIPVDADQLRGESLCMISTHVLFKVYMEGELIYEYSPEIPRVSGVSYGNEIHTVPIPNFSGHSEIVIECEELGDFNWAGFSDAYFMSERDYIRGIESKEIWKVVICIFTFLAGILFVLAGISYEEGSFKLEAASLGAMAMVLSTWIVTGTNYFIYIIGNPFAVRILNYLSLMFLPLTALTYVACLLDRERTKSIPIVMVFTLISIVANIICVMIMGMDYHSTLIFTHVSFVFSVLCAVYILIRALKDKTIKDKEHMVTFIAFSFLTLSGVLDLVMYYVQHSKDMARFSSFGLLIFMIIMGIFEIRRFINVTQESKEIAVINRMAHVDGLTGLLNRRAFSEYEEEILGKIGLRCMFVQFDINNLKIVNDSYGHSAGDEFIIGASEAIFDSFGRYGKVFRTGGDEFVCIMTREEMNKIFDASGRKAESTEKAFNFCKDRMYDKILEYNNNNNPPIKLEVASGFAECVIGEDKLNLMEQLADKRMYEDKKKLKGTAAG